MLRLLGAEGYKLRRSRSFYVCMAVMALFTFFVYGIYAIAEETASVSTLENVGIPGVLRQAFSGDMMVCVVSIFVSIFVVGEFGSGMLKNLVGKGCSRAEIYISKLTACIFGVVAIVLTSLCAAFLGGLVLLGRDAFAGDFWKNTAIFAGLQILMEIALTAIFMLAGECSRNYAAGITLCLGIAAFPGILLSGLDMLWGKEGFSLSGCWLVTRASSCPTEGFTPGFIGETVLISAVWFGAALLLGIWHFYKADIV